MLPLSEILSTMLDKTISAKIVWKEYNKLLRRFGSEYNILTDAPEDKLKEEVHEKIAGAIIKNRVGELKVEPGYDGVYGELVIEGINEKEIEEEKKKPKPQQKGLSEFF